MIFKNIILIKEKCHPEFISGSIARTASLLLKTFLLVFFWLITSLSRQAVAQNEVTIIEANRIVGGTYQGERVQKILGDVHLKTEEIEIYADSVYQFVNLNEIRASGNIEIITDTERIWADSLVYYTDIDFSKLRGRVIIEADSTTLFGNSVDYRFSTKVAHFLDEIRFEDQRGVLLANSGFYFREADSAVFRGQVQLSDSLQYLEGDSLFINRQTEYYELYGDIFGHDRDNHSMLQGHYLEADSTGKRILKGNAWIKNFEPDSADSAQTDTTHIQAKIIISESIESPADTTTLVHAFENVRIWSPDFSAIGDTLLYIDSTQTFEIWSNSIAWHENVQLTGPYIKATLKNGDIDSLISYPRPFSVQQDTSLNRLNQITGDTLEADFEEGSLEEIYVYGNAHLLRFTKNEAGEADGAIDLTAPDIFIFFENGELVEMKAIGAVNGSYLPGGPETAERRLEGFAWNPDLRPQRPEEGMERRFPPIPDEVFFELPPRYINHLKKEHPESPKLDSVITSKE
ncbi:MAG TPA: OstA-like protein [Balneolaceae bacterium]